VEIKVCEASLNRLNTMTCSYNGTAFGQVNNH